MLREKVSLMMMRFAPKRLAWWWMSCPLGLLPNRSWSIRKWLQSRKVKVVFNESALQGLENAIGEIVDQATPEDETLIKDGASKKAKAEYTIHAVADWKRRFDAANN